MATFYSNTNRTPRIQETFTNKEQKVYKEVIDKKTGERKLESTETVNIYDKIQEYKDEVNIQSMIKRYGIQTNTALKESESKLIDLTNIPENLIETMAVIDNAKDVWDKQSKEVKQKFNNDFKQFIAGSENGQIVNILNENLNKQHTQPVIPSYQELLSTIQKQNTDIQNLTKQTQAYKSQLETKQTQGVENV